MVVEDQAEVRKYVREVLAGNGYEVMTASGGQEALALFQEDGRRWDLLLTDVVMPGMNGTELAAAIADLEKGPPVPVLFMSGYARGELDGHGATAVSGIHLLEKPFAPETLLLRVAQHFS